MNNKNKNKNKNKYKPDVNTQIATGWGYLRAKIVRKAKTDSTSGAVCMRILRECPELLSAGQYIFCHPGQMYILLAIVK